MPPSFHWVIYVWLILMAAAAWLCHLANQEVW